MADDITLRIDGVDWTYWTSVQVTRQMDAIAGTFSLALADKWIGGAQALPIAAGMACQILIGGEQVIDGYIDQVRPSFSATAHGISVTGRDRSADLVDCAAIHSPGQWLNCTVLQLAQALASPFGVNVTAEGDVGAPIASFKLEEGETAFEALDRALRQRELMACPDGKGGIVLLKAGAGTASGSLRQGENILSAEGQFDMADRFSDYIVKGQKPGTDKGWGKDACAVRGQYRDQAVQRYRPMLIRAEQSGDSSNAHQRAAWECSVRAARAVTVTATVQGFRQQGVGREQSGPLWQLNQMADVDLPYLPASPCATRPLLSPSPKKRKRAAPAAVAAMPKWRRKWTCRPAWLRTPRHGKRPSNERPSNYSSSGTIVPPHAQHRGAWRHLAGT